MARTVPSFPAIQEWQRMSESDQDALLDRIETVRRRRRRLHVVLIGLVCVLTAAAAAYALY